MTATPAFTFSSTEGGSSFQCRVDSGTFTACSSPHTTASLTNGQHTFSVRATDQAGNTDASPASRTFTVDVPGNDPPPDTDPPDTSITAGPGEGATINTPTATFSFSSTEDGSTFQCRVGSGTFTACSSPHTTASLSNGQHTFSVRATDQAGNTDASPASRTFTVNVPGNDPDPVPPDPDKPDTTAPDTSITSKPAKSTRNRRARFRFVSTEPGSTFQCKLDRGPFKSCRSPLVLRVKPGRHTFQVKARDAAGNVDPSAAKHTWRVKKPRR